MAVIHTIDYVRKAYVRALALHPDPEVALLATAQSLGLPVEAVQQAIEEEAEA